MEKQANAQELISLNYTKQDNDNLKGFVERFKVLLNAKAMRQTDLANLLGVDRSYINNIINQREDPPLYTKIKIAQALGVDSRAIWD